MNITTALLSERDRSVNLTQLYQHGVRHLILRAYSRGIKDRLFESMYTNSISRMTIGCYIDSIAKSGAQADAEIYKLLRCLDTKRISCGVWIHYADIDRAICDSNILQRQISLLNSSGYCAGVIISYSDFENYQSYWEALQIPIMISDDTHNPLPLSVTAYHFRRLYLDAAHYVDLYETTKDLCMTMLIHTKRLIESLE